MILPLASYRIDTSSCRVLCTRLYNRVRFGLASDIKEKKLKNALAHMKSFRISSVRISLFTRMYVLPT